MKKIILRKAEEFCFKNKHRLTEPRFIVLKIISLSRKPLKAYEILEELGKVIKNPKPPTAYRAIEFWHKHNFIHRIESLNAYSICEANHLHEGSQYLICDDCGKVIESHFCEMPKIIKESLKNNTFTASAWNLEINGLCSDCK